MSAPDNGGPAFPPMHDPNTHAFGMTLRDYFAAKAMQGMLAVPDDQRYGDRADQTLSVEQWQAWCVTGVVEHAYRMADAMLKARAS
ncbi:hypothetical protein [Hydrogenophaga sp. 2FB]|uniref:hypothetical protein n=1 Tax=Hydrogenophaga sp. 2FB TaxID=2502187 RepID=UPI0010F60580|nr:hypothetical protein [Hydrogenophaga sp. 2FB]